MIKYLNLNISHKPTILNLKSTIMSTTRVVWVRPMVSTVLYLLDKFTNKQELPTINKQFVLDVIKTISSPNSKRGQKTKEENIKNASGKTDMKQFYNQEFSKLVSTKPSYSNKTHILAITANEMITCINTNISTHFIKHLFKYINCLFKEPKLLEIKKETLADQALIGEMYPI